MQPENADELNNKRFNIAVSVIAIFLILFDFNALETMMWGSNDVFTYLIPPLISFFILTRWFYFLRLKLSRAGAVFAILISSVLLIIVTLALLLSRYLFDLDWGWFYDEQTMIKAVIISCFVGINNLFRLDKMIEKLLKILCLTMIFFSSFFSILAVGAMETYKGMIYRESISIATISDQYLYSTNGNPLGIFMEYSITSNKDIENYSSIDLKSPHGFKLNADPSKYANEQSPLVIFNAQIEPAPTRHTLLKGQTYKVSLYSVPEYIQDKVLGYLEVANLKIEGGKLTNLESVCINEKERKILVKEKETGFYSTNFRSWHTITHNSYSPFDLYQGYVKEGVSSCTNAGI
jgi:hypothetical protein